MSPARLITQLRLPFLFALITALTFVLLVETADAGQQRRRQPTRHSVQQASTANYCSVESRCATILIDGRTGTILRGDNFDRQVYPASLTKLMTLYLMFEAIENRRFELTDRIPISSHAAAASPTKIGLSPGSTITVEDAIEAVAVKSANDIAIAIAEAISGSEYSFARRMNQKAQALGMTRTSFQNASGLPNPGQITTARDMATLAQRMLHDFPDYKHYLGLRAAEVAGRRIEGHNRLLNSGDCTGGKTGYINASGYNLVAWNERNGRQVIAAVFGGRSIGARDRKVAELLRAGMGVIPSPATQQIAEASLNAARTWTPSALPKPRPPLDANGQPIEAASTLPLPLPPQTAPAQQDIASLTAEASSTDEDAAEVVDPEAPAITPEANDAITTVSASSFKTPAHSFAESWAIQVGAYRDEVQAQRALAQATRTLPALLGSAYPRTLVTSTTMGQLHRAQMIGLDESSAREACSILSQNGMQCLTMPPGQAS